jgi:hypothetical protein
MSRNMPDYSYVRFQLNSCLLHISLQKDGVHTGIKGTLCLLFLCLSAKYIIFIFLFTVFLTHFFPETVTFLHL